MMRRATATTPIAHKLAALTDTASQIYKEHKRYLNEDYTIFKLLVKHLGISHSQWFLPAYSRYRDNKRITLKDT